MQYTTDSTVEDIIRVGAVINEINEVIGGIATAVEEQSAATADIANSALGVSRSAGDIAASIGDVTTASHQTIRSAEIVSAISGELVEQANVLKESVAAFTGKVAQG